MILRKPGRWHGRIIYLHIPPHKKSFRSFSSDRAYCWPDAVFRSLRPKIFHIAHLELPARDPCLATDVTRDAMASRPSPAQRHATRSESHESRTLTVENTESNETPVPDPSAAVVGRLHLQGHRVEPSEPDRTQGSRRRRAHVVWSEDTVDNEGMGKKKSKSMYMLSKIMAHTCSLLYFSQTTRF